LHLLSVSLNFGLCLFYVHERERERERDFAEKSLETCRETSESYLSRLAMQFQLPPFPPSDDGGLDRPSLLESSGKYRGCLSFPFYVTL